MQLKLFLSVAQTLNFTKTANEFYMTQPTVSNYIKALERSLGVRLLNRDSHNVALTTEGCEFLEYAGRLLVMQLEAETRLRNISKGRSGYIKIAMLSSMAQLFSECLLDFSRTHPNVQVDVSKLEGVEMTKAVEQREYDIYFANLYMLPASRNLTYIVTGTDQLRLYVHKHIVGRIDMKNWAAIQKYRFVSVPAMDFALSGQVAKICENRGIVPDIINFYNHADMVLLAVNSGIGIAILPPGLTFYNFPNVTSMPIDGEDAMIQSAMAWHEDKLSQDARNFLGIRSVQKLQQDQ